MADSVTFTVDPGGVFQRNLQRKLATSSRTMADVLNQTILNVAGRAMNETPIADKNKIALEIGETARALRRTKKGKLIRGKRIYASSNQNVEAPAAALIINARRAKEGKPGLYGAAMAKAIRGFVGGRLRSVGFNRTGYIPGIREVAAKLKRPFLIGRMRGFSIIGQNKGRAIPAVASFNPVAWIINSVQSILKIKGEVALEKAFAAEAVEMERHYAEKMQKVFDTN